MTRKLKEFLRMWLEWAERNNPSDYFSKRHGLCSNARWHGGQSLMDELIQELEKDFGRDAPYPFGQCEYDTHYVLGRQHQHEPRLAWVRSKIS